MNRSVGKLLGKLNCWKVARVKVTKEIVLSELHKKLLVQSCRRNCWVEVVEEILGVEVVKIKIFENKFYQEERLTWSWMGLCQGLQALELRHLNIL